MSNLACRSFKISVYLLSKNIFSLKIISLVEIIIPLCGIQILQILVKSQLIRQSIQAHGSSLFSLFFFSWVSNIIAYALQLQAFRYTSYGFLNLLLARKVQNLLYSDFHLLLSRGVRSRRQTVQLTISFYRLCGRLAVILIVCNFLMIMPPECLAVLF